MKRNLLALVLTVFSLGAAANAEEVLLKFDYSVRANRNYQTKFFRVNGYPRYVKRIRIATRGDYCKLSLSEVEFLNREGAYAQQAIYTGYPGIYEIPMGVLRSVNIHFRQTTYRKAICEILVYRSEW